LGIFEAQTLGGDAVGREAGQVFSRVAASEKGALLSSNRLSGTALRMRAQAATTLSLKRITRDRLPKVIEPFLSAGNAPTSGACSGGR